MTDTIVKKYNKQTRTFYVYDLDEAKKLGYATKPWREALPGDLAETDDGFACELLDVKQYTDRGSTRTHELRVFSIGRIWVKPGIRLEYLPRKATGNFYGTSTKTWVEREAGRTRTKNVVAVFAQQILAGKIDYDQLGQVYRPDQLVPAATVKRLLKQERIQSMVDDKLKQILADQGVTEEYVLGLFKDGVEVAKGKKDPANILRAAEDLSKILGMESSKTKNSLQIQVGTADIEQRIAVAEEEMKRIGE